MSWTRCGIHAEVQQAAPIPIIAALTAAVAIRTVARPRARDSIGRSLCYGTGGAAMSALVLSLLLAGAVPVRPVHTYSIVARDAATGEMGVAVQSHWFSVGAVVPWAEAGVGAVATQSFVDPSYGKLGLDLMRAGKSAPDALKALLAGDEGR